MSADNVFLIELTLNFISLKAFLRYRVYKRRYTRMDGPPENIMSLTVLLLAWKHKNKNVDK